jgi:hypothetical protein
MERMHGVSTRGSIVWDRGEKILKSLYIEIDMLAALPNIESPRDGFLGPGLDVDVLPRFADLTNDEDRELKATGKKPGTYNLVCNPESFTNPLDEDEDDPGGASGNYVLSAASSVIGNEDSETLVEDLWNSAFSLPSDIEDDPEVVILKRFEEPSLLRRTSLASASAASRASTGSSSGTTPSAASSGDMMQFSPEVSWILDTTELVTKDLEYYRLYIAPRLMKMHDAGLYPIEPGANMPSTGAILILDAFENESIKFPPVGSKKS